MLSEKRGVLIYYKHLKILEEAHLTDEEIGKILSAAIKYDEIGVLPQFDSPLSAFFTMIKYDLDANWEKWEEVRRERSEAGKKGGRPPKKPKEPKGFDETKRTNRFADGQDDDGEFGISQLFPEIKNVVRNIGFFIDNSTAQRFCDCGLDPAWLHGSHSFLELAAERILENYGDKPQGEQKALFISAVRGWEELRDEYPQWKSRKEVEDKAVVVKTAKKAAREDHPTDCTCGNTLRLSYEGNWLCDSCKTSYVLNHETLEWEAEKYEPLGSFSDHFKDFLKGGSNEKEND